MDLSFQEKKRFENPSLGCRDIKQKPSLIFFGTPCTCIRKVLPYIRGIKVALGPSSQLKLYISSGVTTCTLHYAHCTMHNAHCAMHIALCTLHCTRDIALCTVQYAHCIKHIAHYTLYVAKCML